MLRTTKDDEGCDTECPACGRRLITGRCFVCGWGPRPCDGCDDPAQRMFIDEVTENEKTTIKEVFLCNKCAEYSFEVQNDDARTP